MLQFNNSTVTNDFKVSTIRVLNFTNCEDLNLGQVNKSCANISNEYHGQREYFNNTDSLLVNIKDQLLYTICSLGLIMNILNIIAISNAPSQLSQHSRLVISLAISDMCIVLPHLVWPLVLKYYDRYRCFHSIVNCYFEPGVTLVSLLNLLALGIDHLIAIVKPLHYNRIISKRRITVSIALIWIVSFFTVVTETLPEIVSYCGNNEQAPSFCLHMRERYAPRIPYFLVIPELFILITLYGRMYAAYKQFIARQQLFRPDDQHNNKAIVTTLLIIGTFMVGWVPYSLVNILQSSFSDTSFYAYILHYRYLWFIDIMCKLLICLNSVCDALIYAFRLGVVRQGYKAIFRKLCRTCQVHFRKRHNTDATRITPEQAQIDLG